MDDGVDVSREGDDNDADDVAAMSWFMAGTRMMEVRVLLSIAFSLSC